MADVQVPPVPLDERTLALKERELKAWERELSAKDAESKKSSWFSNPMAIAIVAAAFGLIANALVAYFNNSGVQQTAQLQAQSSLILEVIKTGNPTDACKNLTFLVNLGLIKDGAKEIQKQCGKITGPPSLPVPSGFNINSGGLPLGSTGISGVVVDASDSAPISGAKVSSSKGGPDTVTDATGKFTLVGVPFLAELTVAKDGYMTQSLSTLSFSSGQRVLLVKQHQ